MSKIKEVKAIEDSQYEYSAELATDFIEDEILSKLDEFELANDDNYIYGMATHGLFAECVTRLGLMGYTEKDLKKELKIWLNTSTGQILH
jgi:hypothetical protein